MSIGKMRSLLSTAGLIISITGLVFPADRLIVNERVSAKDNAYLQIRREVLTGSKVDKVPSLAARLTTFFPGDFKINLPPDVKEVIRLSVSGKQEWLIADFLEGYVIDRLSGHTAKFCTERLLLHLNRDATNSEPYLDSLARKHAEAADIKGAFEKFSIDFKQARPVRGPFLTYAPDPKSDLFYYLDGKIAWLFEVSAGSNGQVKLSCVRRLDVLELDPRFREQVMPILKAVIIECQNELKPGEKLFYTMSVYPKLQKDIRTSLGKEWKTPQELNPHIIFE
jgi:hypothetical protein